MIRSSTLVAALALGHLALLSLPAAADDGPKLSEKADYVIDTKEKKDEVKQGWDPRLNMGATGSLGDNRGVVGQADGPTIALGFKFDGAAAYNRGPHEWRTALTVAGAITRTPVVPVFVKSADLLSLNSIYLYHVTSWFGPFVRASMVTSMFRGADVRPAPVVYAITHPDGTVTLTRPTAHLALTAPFKPMTLKQSAGPFARLLEKEKANLELRAGLGAQETRAEGQLAVTDAKVTPLAVKELSDVNQLGVEVAADFWGAAYDKKVTYRLGIDLMVPFVHSALPAGDTRGALDLMNIEAGGALSFKLVDWASVDYELKIVREPQVLEEYQVRNSLLLSFGLSYGGDEKK